MNKSLRHVILVLALILAVPVASNTYAPFYIVEGHSMFPAFHPDDIVLVHHYFPQHMNDWMGRVIVFFDLVSGNIIIHRVVAIDGQYLKTKGDNNMSADAFEPFAGDVLGIVYAHMAGALSFKHL